MYTIYHRSPIAYRYNMPYFYAGVHKFTFLESCNFENSIIFPSVMYGVGFPKQTQSILVFHESIHLKYEAENKNSGSRILKPSTQNKISLNPRA